MMMSSLLTNPLNSSPLVANTASNTVNNGTREIMDQLLQLQMQQTQTVLALQQQLPAQISRNQFERNLTLSSGLTSGSQLPVATPTATSSAISMVSNKRKLDPKNDQIVPISTIKDRSSDQEVEETSDLPIEIESKRRKYSSENTSRKSYRIADLIETSQDENIDIEVIGTCSSSISIKPLTTSTPKKGLYHYNLFDSISYRVYI